MNATTQAKTRNVYVRDIMMPVVFCKDCKYWAEFTFNNPHFHIVMCPFYHYCGRLYQDGNTESIGFYMEADDFCSRGERKKPTEF